MTIRCAIMQPTYIPWMGYFALIDAVDVFVLLDTVQLTRRSWQVRNRIKSASGAELMLTIPVRKTHSRDELMLESAMVNDDMPWRRKHANSFRHAYNKADHFEFAFGILTKTLENRKQDRVSRINEEIIRNLAGALGMETRIFRASSIPINPSGKAGRLVEICRYFGATTYVSAAGSASYLEEESSRALFDAAGIEIRYQNYRHPEYPQINGPFLSHLSILDLVANVGPKRAVEYVRTGHSEVLDAALLNSGP